MILHFNPPRHGEGDQPQAGGGGSPLAIRLLHTPSTTPLRVAVPLPASGEDL